MFLVAAIIISLLILGFTLLIRTKDLPEPTPVSPYHHLEVRKASIYENLRDLQFEYRLGKLSDEDYRRTKVELQGQLAIVLGEIDKIKQLEGVRPAPVKTKGASKKAADTGTVCPHCSAKFDKPLKFCGECGKSMAAEVG
jgi:rRNA maturation endonuclease Nob1